MLLSRDIDATLEKYLIAISGALSKAFSRTVSRSNELCYSVYDDYAYMTGVATLAFQLSHYIGSFRTGHNWT